MEPSTQPRGSLPAACYLLLASFSLVLSGCRDPHGGLSQADHDKARESLEKALTAWKSGEPATKWTAANAPIRFVDDSWSKGHALVDYEIVTVRANLDGYPEALVRLTVQPRGGPLQDSEALYGIDVKKGNQVSIGRDPLH